MSPNQRKICRPAKDFAKLEICELTAIMESMADGKAWSLWFYFYSKLEKESVIALDAHDIMQKLGYGEKALKSAWDFLIGHNYLLFEKTNLYTLHNGNSEITEKPGHKNLNKKIGYFVYKLTFPNSKVYIGITGASPIQRWQNGQGYKYNKEMYAAIQEFGWEKISKEIIYEGLTKQQANSLETELIAKYYQETGVYNHDKLPVYG